MFKKLALSLVLLQAINVNAAISLTKIATYNTSLGSGSAEISAYDKGSQRLFVINSEFGSFSIVDLSNVTSPTLISTIDVSTIGMTTTSITVYDGLVAVAIPHNNITENGSVAFFDINGQLLNQLTVGALPDMITFNHQGDKVLVANEGEAYGGVDPDGSISIIDLANGVHSATVSHLSFTAFNRGRPRANELPVNTIIFPSKEVSEDLEPEYISILKDDSKAYVTLQENNAVAVIDLHNNSIEAIHALGFKDYSLIGNEFDPSNKDGVGGLGSIEIDNWPVFGMYQPDAIASYSINGINYYLTANEGDVREEDVRVKDLTLNAQSFPNLATLQTDAELGRLKVSSVLGDTDQDNEFEKLYAYGARSFSIWNAQTGIQVYDSGSQMENQVAIQTPAQFNTNRSMTGTFDSRSDDKGPEPEGIIVAEIGSQQFAFVGLERVGGVMVYNISEPQAASFEMYQPSTDADAAPEGLTFINSVDNSSGKNLLLVSHEDTGTIAIYSVVDTIHKKGFEP